MLKSKNRLRDSEDFQRAIEQGKSVANRQVVIYFLPNEEQDDIRVGISVSKKLGKAVVRNRVKRLLRESIRSFLPFIHRKGDLIIIARQPLAEMNFDEVSASLSHCLKKAKLLT